MTSFHEKVQASTGELLITVGIRGRHLGMLGVYSGGKGGEREEIPFELCADTSSPKPLF